MTFTRHEPGIPKWIGFTLMKRRQYLGLSREKLGKKLGVSRVAVYRWENDINTPTASQVYGIARAMKCEPEDFARKAFID